MSADYKFFEEIARSVDIQKDSIVSRSLSADDRFRVMIFGFDAGQELTEHTAAVPAILQIVSGEADLTLGDDKKDGKPGTLAHMPANLPHSVYARTPVVMLLIMAGKKA